MILTVVVAPDDPKTPLGRTPLVPRRPATSSDDRDRQPPKSRPFGIQITPSPGVPRDEFTEEPKTDAHTDPLVELRARTRSIQIATSNLSSWKATVEGDIANIKATQAVQGDQLDGQDRKLDTLQVGVSSTNQMLGHVVSLATGTFTAKHTEDEVQLKLGAAHETDKLNAQEHRRERITVSVKTVMAALGAFMTSGVVGALIVKAVSC